MYQHGLKKQCNLINPFEYMSSEGLRDKGYNATVRNTNTLY